MDMQIIKKENPHKGHRSRLKNEFLKNGLDNFELYRIIELLLFFSIPQGDVNELAHRLADRYGSLAAMCDAPVEQLAQTEGVGMHTATLIKLVPALARRYILGGGSKDRYDNIEKLGKMLCARYVGITNEVVYLTLLDNSYKMIDFIKIHEGSVNSVAVNPRACIEAAIDRRAAMAVISHNHPHGIAVASSDDMNTTKTLSDAFEIVGIPLLEHIIVAGNVYRPLVVRTNEMLYQRPKYRGFYSGIDTEKFYGRAWDDEENDAVTVELMKKLGEEN